MSNSSAILVAKQDNKYHVGHVYNIMNTDYESQEFLKSFAKDHSEEFSILENAMARAHDMLVEKNDPHTEISDIEYDIVLTKEVSADLEFIF